MHVGTAADDDTVIGLQDYWRQLSANTSIVACGTANQTSCLRPVVGSASLLSATAMFWRLAIIASVLLPWNVLSRTVSHQSHAGNVGIIPCRPVPLRQVFLSIQQLSHPTHVDKAGLSCHYPAFTVDRNRTLSSPPTAACTLIAKKPLRVQQDQGLGTSKRSGRRMRRATQSIAETNPHNGLCTQRKGHSICEANHSGVDGKWILS